MVKSMLEIERATNGYVIEVKAPIKSDKKEDSKSMMLSYPGSGETTFVAKDPTEVADIINKLIPMLDDTFTSEDEFNAAFEKAAK